MILADLACGAIRTCFAFLPRRCCRVANATTSGKQRLAYIDWMRGLACVVMFQTHCYDSWLGGPARQTSFIRWSQLGGTLPAPLFLFLAGIPAHCSPTACGKRGLLQTGSHEREFGAGLKFLRSGCCFACRSSHWGSRGRLGPICSAWTC